MSSQTNHPPSEDTCRPVDLPDGTVVRVHGSAEMDARERELFAILVKAARERFLREHPPVGCGNATGMSIHQCQARPEGCSCFPRDGEPA